MKIDFKEPKLHDRETINNILKNSGNISSESAFGTLYLWSEADNIKFFIKDNILFKKLGSTYEIPKGAKNLKQLEEAIIFLKQNLQKNEKLKFVNLLDLDIKNLEKIFGEKISFSISRNDFDYIYNINDLAKLSGKKYHSKRNHISKFNKLYKWEYISDIKNSNTLDFFEKWFKMYTNEKNIYSIKEYIAIKKAINNFDVLKLFGGIIKIGDKIVACTIGEKINKDVLLVHFEKGILDFEGVYSVINNEFCKHQIKNCTLVNREDDMGILGLRKSKLSYKPTILLKKYNAVLEE